MNKILKILYYILLIYPCLVSFGEFWKYLKQLFNSEFLFFSLFPILFVIFMSLYIFIGYRNRIKAIIQKRGKVNDDRDIKLQNEKNYMIFSNITIFVLIFHPEKNNALIYVWSILLLLSIVLLQINYFFEKKH